MVAKMGKNRLKKMVKGCSTSHVGDYWEQPCFFILLFDYSFRWFQ